MTRWSHAALLGLALAGCDARSLVVGQGAPIASVGGGDRPPQERCPDGAQARAADDDCWPTRHVGRWRGFVTGDARYRHVLAEPLELPSGEVLLEIEPDGTGTLSFAPDRQQTCEADAGVARAGAAVSGDAGAGVADAGAAAADAGADAPSACSDSDAGVAGAPRPGVLLGHRYTLDSLSMSGAADRERKDDRRVSFLLLIAEPWRDWCSAQALASSDTPCSCSAEGCSPSPEVLLGSLSLSRDGQALRGTLGSSADPALVAGLELIRP